MLTAPRGGVIAVVLGCLLAALTSTPLASASSADPRFTVDEHLLRAATVCDPTLSAGQVGRAVLLVHGTGATPDEAWGWNYAIGLRRAGYGVCTVRLPQRALADLTVSAEYVAWAGLHAARLSKHRIAIIGHSQGGLLSVWSTTFWPTLARKTADVISLAGPLRGTRLANVLCLAQACSPVAWQMRQGSRLITALAAQPAPRGTAFTSIGTRQDEIVFPQPAASTVTGGTTTMVQELCPGRVVDHGFLLADSAAYALALDALRHDGPAVASRVDRSVCRRPLMADADLAGALGFGRTAASLSVGLLNVAAWVTTEPTVPEYAR